MEKNTNSDDLLEFNDGYFSSDSNNNELNFLESDTLIKTTFTDIGIYSYVSLVSISLQEIFAKNIDNKQFCYKTIKCLFKHLNRCLKLESSMLLVVDGEVSFDSDKLVDKILEEPLVKKSGIQIVLLDLLMLSISAGLYDARSRTLIKHLAILLNTENNLLRDLEENIEKAFNEKAYQLNVLEVQEKERLERNRTIKKVALISLVTITGGAIIGLTAGLATPLVAASAGAVFGGAGAAFFGTVGGAALMGSLFGLAGAGLSGYKMKKRVGGVEEFKFVQMSGGRSLNVTIAVTGWINDEFPDTTKVWCGLNNSIEQYALCYESKYLRELGQSMNYMKGIDVGSSFVTGFVKTVLMPTLLIGSASIIDNPWHVLMTRSWNAGLQLAEVLIGRKHGKRPVTLIGFSFGARVIFSCLLELATRTGGLGIVEEVILLGTPVACNLNEWKKVLNIVSGRIVNGYCSNDWVLRYVYRTASMELDVAGLGPILLDNCLMQNIDLSFIVDGHMDYLNKMDQILNSLNIEMTRTEVKEGNLARLFDECQSNTNVKLQAETGDKSEFSDKQILLNANMNLSECCSVDNFVSSNINSKLNLECSTNNKHIEPNVDIDSRKYGIVDIDEGLLNTNIELNIELTKCTTN